MKDYQIHCPDSKKKHVHIMVHPEDAEFITERLKLADEYCKLVRRVNWNEWVFDLMECIEKSYEEKNHNALVVYAYGAINELLNFVFVRDNI